MKETAVAPGSGPRHMSVNNDAGLVYLVNELRLGLDVFSVDDDSGALSQVASIEYDLGEGASDGDGPQYGAEIRLHPDGRFLYITNRGFGCVVVFDVVSPEEGFLRQKQLVQLEGTWPRCCGGLKTSAYSSQ